MLLSLVCEDAEVETEVPSPHNMSLLSPERGVWAQRWAPGIPVGLGVQILAAVAPGSL
jgi:hypothetical protein